MNKQSYQFTFIQDGTQLDQNIEKRFSHLFSERDLIRTVEGNNVNFVGFIFADDEALVSFPKHFFTEKELIKLNHFKLKDKRDNYYVELLYKLLKRIIVSNSIKLFEVKKDLNKSYPFTAFLKVYDYYQKYGLFTKKREVKQFDHFGKILWKDTIKRSPLIINKGNLLYWPPVVKKYNDDFSFLSRCMAYAINTTIEKFSFLDNFSRVNLEYKNSEFANIERILRQLNNVKQQIFKDIDLELIEQLIVFFKKLNAIGNIIDVKIYSFHIVWEDLVRKYLNKHFVEIDENNKFIFSESGRENKNFKKQIYHIDARRHQKGINTYKIIPDYIYEDENNRYIFDAKYYTKIDDLDYKQVVYYYLLRHYKNKSNKKIRNALFLPTARNNNVNIHVKLDKTFSDTKENLIIFEYYMNMKQLIESYIN